MKQRLIAIVAVISGLLIVSVSLFAQHGNAEFFSGKRVTVRGTVTNWSWSNPHCLLVLDVKDESGSTVHWVLETQPPRSVAATGFSQRTFCNDPLPTSGKIQRLNWGGGSAKAFCDFDDFADRPLHVWCCHFARSKCPAAARGGV